MAVEVKIDNGGLWSSKERASVAEAWVEDAVSSLQEELKRLKRHLDGAEPYNKRLAVYYARKFTTRSLTEIATFFNMSVGAVQYAIKNIEEQMLIGKIFPDDNKGLGLTRGTTPLMEDCR